MSMKFSISLVGLFAVLSCFAENKTFTGANSMNFSDSSSWAGGVLPVDGDFIIIENTTGSAATNDLKNLVVSGILFNGVGSGGPQGTGDNNTFYLRGNSIAFTDGGSFSNAKNVHFYQMCKFNIASGMISMSSTGGGRFDNYADISGDGGFEWTAGLFYSYCSNTYKGGTKYTGGSMGPFRNNSFGYGLVEVAVDKSIAFYNDRGTVHYPNEFKFNGKGSAANSSDYTLDFRGSVVFSNTVTLVSQNRIRSNSTATDLSVVFRKKLIKESNGGYIIHNMQSPGYFISYEDGIYAPGSTVWHDTIGDVRFEKGTSSFANYRLSGGGEVYFNSPGTVPPEAALYFVDSTGEKENKFSFEGDQTMARLYTKEGAETASFVTSVSGARLAVCAQMSDNFCAKITGPVSFVWNPAGAHTFTVLNECSFSGALEISNGTFKAENEVSSLTNISSLVVAAGASLVLGEDVEVNTVLDKLDLSSTANVSFPAGSAFSVREFCVDGVLQMPDKTYSKSTEGFEWLPEGVSIYAAARKIDGVEAVFNGMGGANNAFENNANWASGLAPEFTIGTLPVFAGGTAAVVNNTVKLNGIKHDQDASFALSGNTGVAINLYWGGISLVKAGSTARNFTVGVPVNVCGEQRWFTDKNKTLVFDSSVSDDAIGGYPVVKAGEGTLVLNSENTFTGDLILSNGLVKVAAQGSAGSPGKGAIRVCVVADRIKPILNLEPGAKLERPVVVTRAENSAGAWNHYPFGPSTGSGTCELAGLLTLEEGKMFRIGNMSSAVDLVFSGGIEGGTLYLQTYGDVIITNKPSSFKSFYSDTRAKIKIFAPCTLDPNTESTFSKPETEVHIMNDNVLLAKPRLKFDHRAVLDLHGHDIDVNTVYTAGDLSVKSNFYVRSEEPATINLNTTFSCDAVAKFEGAVSIKKNGNHSYTLQASPLWADAYNSSTGNLEVSGGNLIIGANQRWVGQKAVVSGSSAKLIFRQGAQLSRKTDVEINAAGGLVKLDQGSVVTCAVFRVNGVRMPSGTYGSTQSDAQYKDNTLFATDSAQASLGTLVSLGDGKGLILTFR